MAAASASAILTVPDRPVAERPDTRTSDAADGRFAGLMAQITQRPGPQRPPEQARPTPVRTEDEPRAEASESAPTEATKPLTMPRKPAAKADPSEPKAEAPDVQQNPGATAPVSVPPPTTPVAAVPSPAAVKAEPVPTLTEEKPVPEAMALKTALATSAKDPNGPATQALKDLPTTPQVAITVAASAPGLS